MEHPVEDAVEQRFLSKPIASEEHTAPAQVGNRKGEHAVEALDACVAILFVGVDDGLCIRPGAKHVTAGGQEPTEVVMVVDLAVEHNPDLSVFIGHRLLAAGAVDDGKTTMAKLDPGGVERAAAVRPAMVEGVGHGLDRGCHRRI